jgi:hypothetical protein
VAARGRGADGARFAHEGQLNHYRESSAIRQEQTEFTNVDTATKGTSDQATKSR